MKTRRIALAILLCGLLYSQNTRISPSIQTVYLLDMANALDQHLASRLAIAHILWVVLDPVNADAVLTDSIDAAFWAWLTRTYSPSAATPGGRLARDVPPPGIHRGTVFLVDPRRRMVIWSTYDLPKDASPLELDRTAGRITNRLKSALAKK
jgi:hypothetical protein